MARPISGDHGEFYQSYIDKTIGHTVQELVTNHSSLLNNFVNSLPEQKEDYAYAPGKWSVKDLLQHMIDTERIMTYRALTFARKDAIALPGFEEKEYAISAKASLRNFALLKEEFITLRKATDLFLLSLSDEQLQQKGIANGFSIKVNSLAYIIFGHSLHHQQILQERYLI